MPNQPAFKQMPIIMLTVKTPTEQEKDFLRIIFADNMHKHEFDIQERLDEIKSYTYDNKTSV